MAAKNIFSYIQKALKKPSKILDDDDIQIITPREKEEVSKNLKKVEETGVKRGKYKTWTLDEKVEIGKYAITHTVGKAVRDLSHKYPGLSKQSVSDFKKVALAPPKKSNKRGRPFLLLEEIMNKTIQLVKALRLKGAPISTPVITSIAKGII